MLYKKTLKPYMLNAFYTWTIDVGFTPIIKVQRDDSNQVPEELSQEEFIIFNIHPNATRNLVFGKEHIKFQAKFGHRSEQITIPHSTISRIFSREDNYGLDFDIIESNKKKPLIKIIKKDIQVDDN